MKKSIFNKLILVVIVTLSVLSTILYINPTDVATDSGFDTSYDSGSSSSGGSSSSSGSYSYSSSSGSGTDLSEETESTILAIMFFIIVLIFIIAAIAIVKDKKSSLVLNKKKAISEEEFKKYIKDESMEDFLLKRYQDYLAIQFAWMEFKYDMLSEKTTNELYNQYFMQLETLKTKKQKNIMKEFIYTDSMITNITNNGNQLAVTLELITNFYDYIVDDTSKVVLRGDNTVKVEMHYQMVFIKNNNVTKAYCPNCGAKLKKTSTDTCEFCKTKITKETEEWLLSKKECLNQSRISK